MTTEETPRPEPEVEAENENANHDNADTQSVLTVPASYTAEPDVEPGQRTPRVQRSGPFRDAVTIMPPPENEMNLVMNVWDDDIFPP